MRPKTVDKKVSRAVDQHCQPECTADRHTPTCRKRYQRRREKQVQHPLYGIGQRERKPRLTAGEHGVVDVYFPLRGPLPGPLTPFLIEKLGHNAAPKSRVKRRLTFPQKWDRRAARAKTWVKRRREEFSK